MLVLSASPAQAFGPGPLSSEAEQAPQENPGTETPALTEDENVEEGLSDTEDGAQDTPESDEAGALEEAEAELAPDTEVPDAADATADEAAKTVTAVPDTIALTGRLVVLPVEPTLDGAAPAAETVSEDVARVLLATDSGAYIPVDTTALEGAVAGEAHFAGTGVLPEAARVAVAAQLEAEGALSEEQVLETVNETVLEAEEKLEVSGTVEPPVDAFSGSPMGSAPAKKTHTADVVFFGGGRKFNETMITKLMTQAGTYWKSQSNGAITGLNVKKYKGLTPKYSTCYQDGLWDQAAKSFGANQNTYTNGHHLIVVVDSSYGCGAAGLAGIGGSIHSGGEIWVDIRGWSNASDPVNQSTVNKSLGTLAHEMGHNMSLGHSQSRVCTGRTVDARTTWKNDDQNPGVLRVLKPSGTACKDVEYGNAWDLMGWTRGTGAKPIALGLAQRSALGVNPSGSVRTVQASGGRSQSFTLNPMGNNSGLRGLKIVNPQGESFYVEYRTNVGQDSAGPNATVTYQYDETTAVTNGVVLSKSYPSARILWTDGVWRPYAAKRSTAVTNYRTTGGYANMKHLTMVKGGVSTPISSIAKVRVTNIAGGKATVRVEFTPFVDVSYDRKFAKEINWMSSSNLSTGSNAGGGTRKYLPRDKVTREAMAAFLYRLNTPAGKTAPAGYKIPKVSPFADIKPGDKFYKEIAWMYTSKLSTGTKQASGKPKYLPKQGVTREAMSAFLFRMDTKTKPATLKTSPFADMTPKSKFYKEISWMYRTGLSTGTKQPSGKPKYLPKSTVTREAMAAFIYRYKH
ncbi:S-layer homology domain-containing protein [Leucobacter sp. HY1910]